METPPVSETGIVPRSDLLIRHQTPVIEGILGEERMEAFMQFHRVRSFLVTPNASFNEVLDRGSKMLRENPDQDNPELSSLVQKGQEELLYQLRNNPLPPELLKRTHTIRRAMSEKDLMPADPPELYIGIREAEVAVDNMTDRIKALAQTYSALSKIIEPGQFHALSPERQELLLEIVFMLRNQTFGSDKSFDEKRMKDLANNLGIPAYAPPKTAPQGVNTKYLQTHISADITHQGIAKLTNHLKSLEQWKALDAGELDAKQKRGPNNPKPSMLNIGKRTSPYILEDNFTPRDSDD
ncbi:MAG: hypothetical protein COU09_02645 [Candidatus Harrisonbacteria bacterium CG10_big_fil_rev_8_21_14_0_10_44_23]|uniref:Uncharacterized protein n=1 Tax=Candidatus Harrisonbacteria bacterium CG10_big_fil_rev_8_21_14_0_10_44_23 TaxID=1974585 RepID=A0A2H0UPN6_9BACT|nr:MAG: hypothetical protein COU09_02645 [Candidatus Harrisonbacteria bacterium CG10_big_fil_rev_8_21_14_0_10_44_23]